MKHLFQSFKLIVFFHLIFAGLFLLSGIVYADDELYFNESGDLVFSTYDRRATSGIRYKTVGWVIKRYNDDITANGQYSVNIARSGYMYETEDPNEPGYIYTTFIVDGQTVMDRIRGASSKWAEQLGNYGGYVYVDSIMTVSEWGVDQGGIFSDGGMYGECYNTYFGIRHARGWADGDKLICYYGLKVKYPHKTQSLPVQVVVTGTVSKTDKSAKSSSFSLGSEERGGELFDVSQGIPSGEKLYIYGYADKFYYQVDYRRISGYVRVPVKITTNYRLSWTDTKGYPHVEDEAVERWYYVTRNFQYDKADRVDIYNLLQADGVSQCFEDIRLGNYADKYGYTHIGYGDSVSQYVQINSGYAYNAGTVSVQSTNWQRPDIPAESQQHIAEGVVPQLSVHSDLVKINGYTLLSNEVNKEKGSTLRTLTNIAKQTIEKKGIVIPKETANKEGYTSAVKLTYGNNNQRSYVTNGNLSKVNVHTPVTASVRIAGDKAKNESILPTEKDIVVGDMFYVNFSVAGEHRDIKGYGNKVYGKYIKYAYVQFPFSVQYKTEWYAPQDWIKVEGNSGNFIMAGDTAEGEYTINYMVAAYNLPEQYNTQEAAISVSQNAANTDIQKYCAVGNYQVRAVGKIYGLTLEGENRYFVSGAKAALPEAEVSGKEKEYLPADISFMKEDDGIYQIGVYANAVGDDAGERLEADISYDIWEKGEDGVYIRRPVDVYYAQDNNFNKDTLTKMEEKIVMEGADARAVSEGIYHYTYDFYIPSRLVIVEKGQDIGDISIYSDYILRDRQMIVNVDVYAADNGGRKLSYENKENAKAGYCNMWRREGFSLDRYTDRTLKYGDILMVDTDGIMKNSAFIIGTH